MARKHGGLGRGLDALIPMREEVEKAMSSAESEGVEILFPMMKMIFRLWRK